VEAVEPDPAGPWRMAAIVDSQRIIAACRKQQALSTLPLIDSEEYRYQARDWLDKYDDVIE